MLNRTRYFRVALCLFAIALLPVLTLPAPHTPIQAQGLKGLDLIIALDTSTSMDTLLRASAPLDPETNVSWFKYLTLDRPATDPNGLRFDAASFVFSYLADIAKQRGLDINGSAIVFDSKAKTLVGWQSLGKTTKTSNQQAGTDEAESSASLFNLPTTTTATSSRIRSSNYEELYREVADLIKNRPSGERSPILFIVTDSLDSTSCIQATPPCTTGSALRDMRKANDELAPPNLTQYLFYINAASTEQWPQSNQKQKNVDEIKNGFAQFINRQGESTIFSGGDSIRSVAPAMFKIALKELANVQGIEPTDNVATGYTEIASGGLFKVPPYQNTLTLYVFMGDKTPDVALNSNSVKPDNTETRRSLQILTFKNPSPGKWQVTNSTGAWATFVPATASVSIVPDKPLQFMPLHIEYMLKDADGEPYVQVDNDPEITVTVEQGGNTFKLPVMPRGVSNGQAYISNPFFPMAAVPHTVHFSVSPKSDWNKDSTDYAFLTPANSSAIPVEVGATTFDVTFSATTDSAGGIAHVALPRSQALKVEISSSLERLPEALTATLKLSDLAGATCPNKGDVVIEGKDTKSITTGINFSTQGACQIDALITVKNSLEPQPDLKTVFDKKHIAEVKISNTQRLVLDLLDQNSQPIAQPLTGDTAHYVMDNVLWRPEFLNGAIIRWPDDTHNIEVLFRDEDSKIATTPRLLNAAPAINSTTNGSSTGNSPDTTNCDQSLVPLTLSITHVNGDGTNEAASNQHPIQLCKSAREGYYVAAVHGLPAGDYEVQIKVRDSVKLDQTVNEYAAPLKSPNYVLKGRLHVNFNGIVIAEGVVAALLALLAIALAANRAFTGIVPLSGDVVLYMKDAEGKTTELWRGKCPTDQRSHEFKASELMVPGLVSKLPVSYLSVTTHNKKRVADKKGAYVTVKDGASTLVSNTLLLRGEKAEVKVNNQAKFYVAKVGSGEAISA